MLASCEETLLATLEDNWLIICGDIVRMKSDASSAVSEPIKDDERLDEKFTARPDAMLSLIDELIPAAAISEES